MSERSFLKFILGFISEKKTGALKVKKDQLEKTLYLKNGTIIFVDSTLRYENLGRILVDKGKITEDQFTGLLNKVKETGKRQGETLVELGLLTPFEVFEALKDQLGKKIANCFLLQDFEFEFADGKEHIENITEIPVNVMRTLLDGAQTVYTHEVLKKDGGFSKDIIPVISKEKKEKLNEIRLKPEEVKLLRQFDGKRTLFEIVRDENMDHQFVLATVYFLHSIQTIEYKIKSIPKPAVPKIESPKPENVEKIPQKSESVKEEQSEEPIDKDNPIYDLFLKLDKMGYPEIFGLGIVFKKEDLKRNYESLISKYKLDKIEESYDGPSKDAADKILNRIVTAFTILKDDKKKDQYMKMRAKIIESKPIEEDNLLMSEIEMNKASMYMRKNKNEKALVHLRKAHELNPNEIDYMVSIAEVLMTMHGKGKKPDIPSEVAQMLKKAAVIDQNNIGVYLNLGTYYKLTGKKQKAINCFNKVIGLNPENARANAELRLFNIRGDNKPKFTFFSKKPPKKAVKKSQDD